MKIPGYLSVISIVFLSCSPMTRIDPGSSNYKTSVNQLNSALENRKVRIHLADGRSESAREVSAVGSILTWIDTNGALHKTRCEEVDRIVLVDRMKGAGYGFLAGCAVGIIIGIASAPDEDNPEDSPFAPGASKESITVALAAVNGILYGLGGTIVGALIGAKDSYSFHSTAASDSIKAQK